MRVPEAGRLDVLVAAAVPDLSRSRASRLIRDGQVKVDGVVVTRPAVRIDAGQDLDVDVPPPVAVDVEAQDLPLRIVFEDADVVVIDKDAGMVVHPAPGHPDGTLVNALLHHIDDLSGIGGEERPGIVHRLDRGTSGLIVVAKHDVAHRALAEQFAAHTAGRIYLALCLGSPRQDAGRIESQLARHPRDRLRMASGDDGRRAVTHYQVLARAGTVTLIRCTLETGRTHQVRVHLSEQGWPILGDRLYRRKGARVPATLRDHVDPEGDRPYLHAWQLRFTHPRTGERLELEAPPPADFQDALDALGLTYRPQVA